MKNNLPVKKEDNFIEKIKNFVKKLFSKSKYEKVDEVENIITNKNEEESLASKYKDVVNNNVKNEYVLNKEREEFLKLTEKNPSILYNLPIEKLKTLESYYDEEINMYKNKLYKIKQA